MTYEFNKSKHIHTLDGKPLYGVTTVLSVISKPALIQWSANMAVDFLDGQMKENGYNFEIAVKIWDSLCKEAKSAHRKKKEKAGDWGTNLHKIVEEYIKDGKHPINIDEQTADVFVRFKEWAKEKKVKFLESEKHVWSEELWIGGICDMVIEMDGKKYIADIKTSSGIYNEHFFQMGAYDLCLKSMRVNDIAGYIVINLKKDGNMEVKMVEDIEPNKEAFKSALSLYKIIQSLDRYGNK